MPRILIQELDSTEKGVGSDMSLYFNGTFVKVSADGKVEPVWAKYGHSGAGHNFKTATGAFLVDFMHPKAFIEWRFPIGWFNTKKSAVFSERFTRRQNHKGICSATASFTSAESIAKEITEAEGEVAKTLGHLIGSNANLFTAESIVEVFEKPQYPTVDEAYITIKAKKVFSRALSNDFALIPHPETKDLLVLCHDTPVGEMVTKNKIKMLVPTLKAECLSFFQKEGITVV